MSAVQPIDAALAASLLPARDPRGHKGTFGRVAVVAGSLDYAGAALMAGAAALRTGSGLVTLYLPASLQPILAGRVPELITRGLPERGSGQVHAAAAADLVLEAPHDALLVGPGLAPGAGHQPVSCSACCPPPVPPPSWMPARSTRWRASPAGLDVSGDPCVLTPHPGELQRLGRAAGDDDEARLRAATRGGGRLAPGRRVEGGPHRRRRPRRAGPAIVAEPATPGHGRQRRCAGRHHRLPGRPGAGGPRGGSPGCLPARVDRPSD